ncbi:hypothetical protein SLA2020_077720 [Shorea laevis]
MEYDYLFKLMVIGDLGSCRRPNNPPMFFYVGKSSLIRRLTENAFVESYEEKLGVAVHSYPVNVEAMPINLQIWNLRSRSLVPCYYRGVGALLVYDITRRETFNRIPNLLKEIQSPDFKITIMLVGNKCDLENKRAVTKEEAEQFAQQNGLLFVETSAATAQNVEEAFKRTTANILQKLQDGVIHVPHACIFRSMEQKCSRCREEQARIEKERDEIFEKALDIAIFDRLREREMAPPALTR